MSIKDITEDKPNKNTIKLLEDALERAKSGRTRSIFFIEGFNNATVNHSWSLDYRDSKRRLLAEMVMAQHDFVDNLGLIEKDSVLSIELDKK